MSAELINFLKELEIQIKQKDYVYVYFNINTNKIEKILNTQDPLTNNLNFIKVKEADVENIFSGKSRIEDFKVLYNSKIKNFKLTHLSEKIDYQTIDSKIFRIDKIENSNIDSYDITVRQNNKDNCWNFFVNKSLTTIESVSSSLFFSITAKNDPNILYRTIAIRIDIVDGDCISIPYIYNTERDIANLSVYTNKVLSTYAHEVIND